MITRVRQVLILALLALSVAAPLTACRATSRSKPATNHDAATATPDDPNGVRTRADMH